MTTLQDETNGWLQQNSRSILFLAVLLLGGGAVMWYLPRATQASMQASWQKYSDFQQALLSVDTPDDPNAALNATQDDVRAYKWSTLAAPSWAARTGQEDEYFAIIQNHLNSITGDDGVKILEEGTSVNIVEATKARVEGYRKLDALMPDPIEPTGSKIKVTLTNEAGTNFELVYQLYEEQAPVASAWLLGLIDEGSFAEARPIPSPQNGFQVADLPADGVDGLGPSLAMKMI